MERYILVACLQLLQKSKFMDECYICETSNNYRLAISAVRLYAKELTTNGG